MSIFRVTGVSRGHLTASCFFNSERSLLQPLLFQGGSQQMMWLDTLSGRVVHVLEPEAADEVLTQLDSAVVFEVGRVLLGSVD